MRCPLNIFWPLYLKVAKLGTVYIPRKPMDRIYFQITTSKINVKLILLFKWYSLKIFWPFCFTIIKLRTLDTHIVSMTLLIFRSQGERSRSNCYSLYRCCPLIIFWPLAWNLPNLVQWMSHVVPYWPSGRIVKSQDLTGGFKKMFSAQYLKIPLLLKIVWPFTWKVPSCYTGLLMREDYSYYFLARRSRWN